LQYPLPGLSHCDYLDYVVLFRGEVACSTLYRAYPIATGISRRARGGGEHLQYPLPGLSHCDDKWQTVTYRGGKFLQYPLPGLSHCDAGKYNEKYLC